MENNKRELSKQGKSKRESILRYCFCSASHYYPDWAEVRQVLVARLTTSFLVALEARLQSILDEVVGAHDIASFGILAHPVGEAIDVAAGLEDDVGGENAAIDLENVVLNCERVS